MPEKSAFIEEVFTRAKKTPRRIVLPEGHDERIVKAAGIIARKDLARPIILGIRDRILAQLKSLGMSAEGIEIVNPQGDPRLDDFAKTFFELRRHKGVTLDQARETISSWVYFGTMMVYKGDADCLVCGATHSTRNTIMPALQIIKCKRGCSLVSSLFFMVLGKDVFAFADCGVIENPRASSSRRSPSRRRRPRSTSASPAHRAPLLLHEAPAASPSPGRSSRRWRSRS